MSIFSSLNNRKPEEHSKEWEKESTVVNYTESLREKLNSIATSATNSGTSSTLATNHAESTNLSPESKAATVNRINERIKAKFAKNKEKRKEIKQRSEFLSFSQGETKILLIDLSDPRTGNQESKPSFNNEDEEDREYFRYIFNDISPDSNDTTKKWIWDVGMRNSEKIEDLVEQDGFKKFKVTKPKTGKRMQFIIEGLQD